MEHFLNVVKQYVNFEGRAKREEFWMYFLFYIIIAVAIGVVGGLIGLSFLSSLYSLALLLPSLSVGARRLHDTGRSGWWQLIGLIPLIGIIVLIVFWAQEGHPDENAFGANPLSQ
jgi:uncharacterized membrane protein YhaH (DUF805 family)